MGGGGKIFLFFLDSALFRQSKSFAIAIFLSFSCVPLADWANIAYDARINFTRLINHALRTFDVLTIQIAMGGTNTECRRKGEIGQFIVLSNSAHQFFGRLNVVDSFPQKEM